MTVNQIRDICLRELLYGADFLTKYRSELDELVADLEFMRVIDDISGSVSEELEFSPDRFDPAFQQFKKANINDRFFKENLKFRFPAYCDIVDSVTTGGNKGMSAAISVYYALRYMDIGASSGQRAKPAETAQKAVPVSNSEAVSDQDFRQKWPATYRCDDGHYVRSKNEQLLDNWLYSRNICHAYEPLVTDKRTKREYISDFYLPQLKMYIEIWGYETPEYLKRKEHKTEVYRANNLSLLQVTDREVKNLGDFLQRNVLAKM